MVFELVNPKYHLDDIFDPMQADPDEAHSVLMRLIPPRSKVLELGCASGYLSGYMERSLGCRVTGLEVDPAAAAIAATRCSEVYTADLDSPAALISAHASAPYDVLLAAAVLEHLKYPEKILDHAKGLLSPNATIVVSLPNIAQWQVRLNLLQGRFDYQDYGVMDRTHLRLYTLKTGRELLENAGFSVEQILISGSGLQNVVNKTARRLGQHSPPPLLPAFLGYELIYVGRHAI